MSRRETKIIVTLGPSSFKKKILISFKKLGVFLYRINLSHTSIAQLKSKIIFLKKNHIKNICIDTEGAQLRTTKVKKKIFFKKGTKIKIYNKDNISKNKNIFLYPKFNILSCKLGKTISIGFDDLVLRIIKKDIYDNCLHTEVISPGILDSNKGVHINQDIELNSLTKKDLEGIKIGIKNKINFFALSFANKGKDVADLKKLIPYKPFIISKIETENSIKNLGEITSKSNALLVDRGDLSRYIDLTKIPYAQDYIINFGKKKKKPVFVATNLLENMIKHSAPTRAECNDIYNALNQGVNGLVLAAESAIGKDPVKCVMFLKDSISTHRLVKKNKNRKKFIIN
jgi:pyruvate kinase